jgi:tartrate dehydratase beta subunit/fumarate hydratase class I family protein
VFPIEDSNKTREVAHCQRSHPLFAAPQTEHGVEAGFPMHSSTGPTGSPRVEHTAVVMTGSVGLAGIIGKGCQGHSSPKDDMRFM